MVEEENNINVEMQILKGRRVVVESTSLRSRSFDMHDFLAKN